MDGQGTLLRDSIFQLEDYAIRLSQDSEKIRDLEKRIDSQSSLITKYGEQLEAVKKELNGILGEMEEIKTGLKYGVLAPFLLRYVNLYFGNVGCLVAFRALGNLIFYPLAFL